MTDHRNTSSGFCQDGRGTVCIDTQRVLDSCRDRDCFENTRVYLTNNGEEILAASTNVRARSASILWAYVGVNEVPFNCGFYQVSIRYYVLVELEACLGIGRSQTFKGLAVLEKEVVLYGGEGNVTTFSSNPENSYCSINENNRGTNAPIAIVETVEPMILGTKVKENDCCNSCGCANDSALELPACVCSCFDGDICSGNNGPRLYISFGIFSVIRIVRPAQLLVQATDYSVPDKECVAATNDENPCSVFRAMPFPTSRFRGTMTNNTSTESQKGRGCGCK
ncbi:MAG: hypothetical protein E7678_06725 [Ruminococcaceae bacterium]|nr:hypothetical protein [Oscillospiraceae bacterium]